MRIHRFVIGVALNEKMFRLASLNGELADSILSVIKTNDKLGNNYFKSVEMTNNIDNLSVSFSDKNINNKKVEKKQDDNDGDRVSNFITFRSDQVVFKKVMNDPVMNVNLDDAIDEFELIWRNADQVLKFPSIRRIGFVVEYRIDGKDNILRGNLLSDSLLKFKINGGNGKFNLQFEDREIKDNGKLADPETDDFWNRIYSFYLSEMDETPEKYKINANLDLQKFYNPAKKDPYKELKNIRNALKKEKAKFKSTLEDLGII